MVHLHCQVQVRKGSTRVPEMRWPVYTASKVQVGNMGKVLSSESLGCEIPVGAGSIRVPGMWYNLFRLQARYRWGIWGRKYQTPWDVRWHVYTANKVQLGNMGKVLSSESLVCEMASLHCKQCIGGRTWGIFSHQSPWDMRWPIYTASKVWMG